MQLSHIFFSSILLLVFSNAAHAKGNISIISETIDNHSTCVNLTSFVWQHRLLITRASPSQLSDLHNLLSKNYNALAERKLAVFIVDNDKVLRYRNSSKFKNTGNPLCFAETKARMRNKHTILIGLDGGTKAAYSELDLRIVFADIDGMPMRKAELYKE